MYKLEIIKHNDIISSNFIDIINVKSKAWNYSYEMQMQWINENINSNDFHILLLRNNEYVAYLNLIDIELDVDNKVFKAYGVGNVCSIEKGKGFGKELMKLTNKFIEDNQRLGLLFCKSKLIDFYLMNDWIKIDNKKIFLSFNSDEIYSFIYNCNINYNRIIYKNKSF